MDGKLTVEEHKARVKAAFEKYFSKEDCPNCGLQHWNGSLHAYGGVWGRKKANQHWCNGKIDFYPKRKEDKETVKKDSPKQMEFDFTSKGGVK